MSANSMFDSSKEFSRLGTEIYDRDVRPILRPEDDGRFVAIDIDTGTFDIADDDYAATESLLNRRPQARIWLARAGQPAPYRVGGHVAHGEPK